LGAAQFYEIPEDSTDLFPKIMVFSSIAGQLQASILDSKLFNKQ
jgi:hypothetical protein